MDIKRIKKKNTFFYIKKNKIINDSKILDYIKSLVIPPAWENVVISSNSNSKILCIGYDSKNRKQYKYNLDYIQKQNIYKFYTTLIKFGKKLKFIREDIEKILRKRTWDLEKTTAFVIHIIDNCHLRIGNEKYKEDNSSYGITTLEKKHINIKTTSVYIDFIGKKGVENSCVFKDSKIINLFKSLCNTFNPKKKDSFFKYYGHNNSIYTINSCHINDFLKKYGDFSAKNFRTWYANLFVIKYLYELMYDLYKKKLLQDLTERNKSILLNKAVDGVSEKLNNTRAICKNSYISIDILNDYKNNHYEFFLELKKKNIKNPLHNESLLLKLLNKYKKINK